MKVITCSQCGFNLGIQDIHFEEVAAGVWGIIKCPECSSTMNDDIKAKYDEDLEDS